MRTVWIMGPLAGEACGARLMTCIWAAARLAASGSAAMYFIMTMILGFVKGRVKVAPALQTKVIKRRR